MSQTPEQLQFKNARHSYEARIADDLQVIESEIQIARQRAATPATEPGALVLLQVSVQRMHQATSQMMTSMAALDALYRVQDTVAH